MPIDPTYGGALIAGLITFLSPCILPIVPFYLGYLAGASVPGPDGALRSPGRWRTIVGATAFALGILAIFMLYGLAAGGIAPVVANWMGTFRWIAAAVVLIMGLHFLGVVRIGFLYRQFRADAGNVDALSVPMDFVVGAAFAFGWTPCVGPFLTSVFLLASMQGDTWGAVSLMLVYGIGMTFPFILAAAFFEMFQRFSTWFRRHLGTVEKVMGAMLVVFAVLIATGSVNRIADWMLEMFPGYQELL